MYYYHVNVQYRWTHSVVLPLLCLVCHSMLNDSLLVELLINQKHIYAGVTHILLNALY